MAASLQQLVANYCTKHHSTICSMKLICLSHMKTSCIMNPFNYFSCLTGCSHWGQTTKTTLNFIPFIPISRLHLWYIPRMEKLWSKPVPLLTISRQMLPETEVKLLCFQDPRLTLKAFLNAAKYILPCYLSDVTVVSAAVINQSRETILCALFLVMRAGKVRQMYLDYCGR